MRGSSEKGDSIVLIPLEKIRPFEGQPFQVRMDESMDELVESVKAYGVLTPIAVRPLQEDVYEIIAGHRRAKASELAEKSKVPSKVLELDDDMAIIYLVDSNLQREHILPSEKAFAYQMKLDAMKRQGLRTDLITSSQFGTKFRSDEAVAKECGESRNQIQRYIRLTHLIYQLLDMVDNNKLSVNAAVELSYLGSKAQSDLAQILQRDELRITIKQAVAIRDHSREGKIACDVIEKILRKKVTSSKSEGGGALIRETKIRKYFPTEYSSRQIEKIVIALVRKWAIEQGATQGGYI